MVNTINSLFTHDRKVFDEISQVILWSLISKSISILGVFRDDMKEKRGIL